MILYQVLLVYTLIFYINEFVTSGSGTWGISKPFTDIHLVASTPGDDYIKTLLKIHPAIKVDFIRWDLLLESEKLNQNAFKLNITYGLGQPNTLGFVSGGEKRSFAGTYTIAPHKSQKLQGEIYQLKSSQLPSVISLLKLNENLFHLLSSKNQLLNGNGGWSYTLNRKQPVTTSSEISAILFSSIIPDDTSRQVIYDGRTPCQSLAADHQIKVSPACFKLKWRIILNRNPVNHQPTTYTTRKVVDNEPQNVTGKWTVIKGIPSNPKAIIYQLDPDKPKEAISLLVGDENVLFFLNKDQQLYVGNSDFSFTLNRKRQ